MRVDLDIKHYVKVYEFTYGSYGWHPHIHALFWIPANKFQDIAKYEEQLVEDWWKYGKKAAVKSFSKVYDKETAKIFVENYYTEWRKVAGKHKSVYISKDKYGKIRPINSSIYVSCGETSKWGGDDELAGQWKKQAKPGHYTPFQMLKLAYENPKQTDKWFELFTEYAIATRGKKRVVFSTSGINQIIEDWQKTQTYWSTLKKKFTDEEIKPLQVVAWFSKEQWFQISCIAMDNIHIIADILKQARAPDPMIANQRITEYLLQYGIDISKNIEHPIAKYVEEYTYEHMIRRRQEAKSA